MRLPADIFVPGYADCRRPDRVPHLRRAGLDGHGERVVCQLHGVGIAAVRGGPRVHDCGIPEVWGRRQPVHTGVWGERAQRRCGHRYQSVRKVLCFWWPFRCMSPCCSTHRVFSDLAESDDNNTGGAVAAGFGKVIGIAVGGQVYSARWGIEGWLW